jgi:DNA-binding response OmpR family regulator
MDVSAAKHILVIEDDKDLLESMKSILVDAGFVSTGVSAVREASFKLKNQKYACVVLDLRLGDESGEEIVEFMRTRKEIPNGQTPVLVVSASISPEVMKRLAGRIQGAIVKPFDLQAFTEKVKKLAV